MGLGSNEVVPDVSVLDVRFPMGMPKKLTAGTGLDVFAHAFGGYVSKWKNDFSDAMAIHAIRLGFKYLPRAYKDGDDLDAREKMHHAATIAGISFGNSQVTMEHSIGHAVGAVFHVHHGLAVGIALPYTIQFYSRDERVRELYAELAESIGIDFKNNKEAVAKIIERLNMLMDEIEAPKSYRETGISKDDWNKNKRHITEIAFYDSCYFVSPVIASKEELDNILDCCYEGRNIDF